jgi:hypothetical protein
VYWELDLRPDHVGVAVGAFCDPDFPKPQRAVWDCRRHAWVDLGADLPTYSEGVPRLPQG